jgi:CRISPR system Cascade subunit CasE
MYLSQLRFHALDPRAAKLLGNRYRLHAALMRGYAEANDDERVLFRVEPAAGRSAWQDVLVQGRGAPDWTPLLEDYANACQAQSKPFAIEPAMGQRYRFRLLANPTVTRNRKRYGLVGEATQREWLERRAEGCGFRLQDCTVIDEGLLPAWKKDEGQKRSKGKRLTLRTARYEGLIEIIDPGALGKALENGIGPAKGLGCGLLSLAPG